LKQIFENKFSDDYDNIGEYMKEFKEIAEIGFTLPPIREFADFIRVL